MCVSKENTNAEDFGKFHEFVMTLNPEEPFTQLLNSLGMMLEAGGTICLAMSPTEEQIAQAQAQQQGQPQALPPGPAPGIYPPAPIGNDAPDVGYGQYL